MNINKKLDRLAQWSKEKMGGEVRTTESDDFKALEIEMACRHDGMERLSLATNAYMRTVTRRTEGEGKEKLTPIAYLGSSMTRHGEDFAEDSVFGQCLIGLGQANERIARTQDSFASNSSATWLASVERSLAQMKEYQNARKKLESRRLAFDTSMSKMQRSKREDFRAEEEQRMQKIKYEESAEDVQRRMQDIIEAESDNAYDLYSFLEAELDFHDRCREILLQVKQAWPMTPPASLANPRLAPRSRANTLTRVPTTSTIDEEYLDPRPRIRSRATSAANSPRHELPNFDFSPSKFSPSRSVLSDSPARPIISRTATEPHNLRTSVEPHNLRLPIRTVTTPQHQSQRRIGERDRPVDVFGDDTVHDTTSSSPDERDYGNGMDDRSSSPATSYTPSISRTTSSTALNENDRSMLGGKKQAPPPPPPSRASKPKAPPPPPMKRSALSQSNVLQSYT